MRTANTIITEVCASLPNIQTMSPNEVYEECVKVAQLEAYNQAIDDAAENADYGIAQNDDGQEPWIHESNIFINKDSILKLKKE